MQVVPCPAPLGALEPAPLTCLPLSLERGAVTATAYWSGDDDYYVCVDGELEAGPAVRGWYRFDQETAPAPLLSAEETDRRAAEARQMLDVIPMGCGQVAFPVGSTGRVVYRVWRTRARRGTTDRNLIRTRILGVRAGRSLRRPA